MHPRILIGVGICGAVGFAHFKFSGLFCQGLPIDEPPLY
jgi:hypothetical protein